MTIVFHFPMAFLLFLKFVSFFFFFLPNALRERSGRVLSALGLNCSIQPRLGLPHPPAMPSALCTGDSGLGTHFFLKLCCRYVCLRSYS